jgi:hypothetical protein
LLIGSSCRVQRYQKVPPLFPGKSNLESLKASAEMVLDEVGGNRDAFISAFDELSPSVQTKALRAAWQNPGRSFLDLLDIVEPQLTLSEAHEAEQWVRELRGR